MTIQKLYDKIVSWPENTMNFAITDVFSWRGSYAEPACSIECSLASKEYNLNMLTRLLNETFYGWKGGEYEYSDLDDIHFENCSGSYSDGQYLINFILDHANEPIVQHIFRD